MDKILCIGNLYPDNPRNPEIGRVYDPEGIAPCLNTCGGGNRMPKIIEYSNSNKENLNDSDS